MKTEQQEDLGSWSYSGGKRQEKHSNLEIVPWNLQFVTTPSSTSNSVKYFQHSVAMQFRKQEREKKNTTHQHTTQNKLLSHISKFTSWCFQV